MSESNLHKLSGLGQSVWAEFDPLVSPRPYLVAAG